jgi:hypothetical protein
MDLCEKVSSSEENFNFVLKDCLFDILVDKIDINIKQVTIISTIY